MIKNERQFRITKVWAQRFVQTLARLDADTGRRMPAPSLLKKAERDAAASQLTTLQPEIREYETLRAGEQRI